MLKLVKKIWSNEFFKGGVFITIASFLGNIMNYFFNFLVGRGLGPQQYSEITALFSYISITSVPTYVLSTFLIQKISSIDTNRFAYARSLEKLLWIKIKKWWFIIVGLILLSAIVPNLTNLSLITGSILIPLTFLTFVSSFYGAAMQGVHLFLLFSLINITATFLKLFGAILLLIGVDGFNTVIFFVILSTMTPLVLGYWSLKSQLTKKLTVKLPKIEQRVISLLRNRQFLIILFSSLALTLLNNLDVVWVKKFLDAKEAGIYGSWSIFAKIIFYALGPFISISFIFFSSGKHKQHSILNVSIISLTIIAIISYIVYSNFSTLLIHLFFGEKFSAVAPYLSQASIFGSLYSGIAFMSGYFLAKKSLAALIPAFLIPFYIVLLFFIHKQISAIIILNIAFAATVLFFYAIIYLKNLLNTNTKTP